MLGGRHDGQMFCKVQVPLMQDWMTRGDFEGNFVMTLRTMQINRILKVRRI